MSNKVGIVVGHEPSIYTVAGSEEIVSNTLMGVEVELEAVANNLSVSATRQIIDGLRYWRITQDGSLREGGVEFVLRQPIGGIDLENALKELEVTIEQYGIQPDCNERTSVHVHMDVRDCSVNQLTNLLILYGIFERPLLNFCHESRRNNNFCVPMHESMEFFERYDPDAVARIAHDAQVNNLRYSAVNMAALAKFGSLEFRQHHGAWKYDELKVWVNLLLSMKKFIDDTMKDGDSRELITYLSANGFMPTANNIFGDLLDHIYYDGFENDIADGVAMMQDMAYLGNVMRAAQNNAAVYEGSKVKSEEDDLLMKYAKKKYKGRTIQYVDESNPRFQNPIARFIDGMLLHDGIEARPQDIEALATRARQGRYGDFVLVMRGVLGLPHTSAEEYMREVREYARMTQEARDLGIDRAAPQVVWGTTAVPQPVFHDDEDDEE